MNEGAGNKLIDISMYKNNGVITGALWKPSENGKSLKFNGTSDYISAGSNNSIDDLASGDMSVYVIARHESNGTNSERLVEKGLGTLGWLFAWRNGVHATNPNSFLFVVKRVTGTDASTFSADNTLSDNTWYHLCATWDRVNPPSLYKNGILISSFEGTPTIGSNSIQPDANDPLGIGALGNGGNSFFGGKIALVLLYRNRILKSQEVSSLYTSPYQFIQGNRMQRHWFPAAAVGGVTLNQIERRQPRGVMRGLVRGAV